MSVSNQGSRHSKNDVNVRANEPEVECGDNKQSSITSISPSELERVRDRDENVYRDRLVHLFLLWTLKESYTKALGLGLGFDFKRIEYDSERDLFRVDKRAVNRWEIGVGVLNVSEADTEDKDHEREQERAGDARDERDGHEPGERCGAVGGRVGPVAGSRCIDHARVAGMIMNCGGAPPHVLTKTLRTNRTDSDDPPYSCCCLLHFINHGLSPPLRVANTS